GGDGPSWRPGVRVGAGDRSRGDPDGVPYGVWCPVNAMRKHAAELRGMAETLVPRASAVVRKVAFDTEADAKALAPVDTGMLRNSITTAVSGDGLTASVVATASYA